MGWLKKALGIKEQKEISFTQVTDENFDEEVKQADRPVMLFVWSNTCPHCHKMAPNVKSVGAQYHNVIKATHTGAHLAPETMQALEIQGVPSLLFFDKGELVERVVGFRPESFLEELVQAHFIPNENPSQVNSAMADQG